MKDTEMPTQAELKLMTKPQLWAGLENAMKLTDRAIRMVAAYWCELKNRGEDLSSVDIPWSQYFPTIVAGKLDPRLILAYGWNDGLLAAVAQLVPEDQEKIVNPRKKIPILVPTADASAFQTVMRAPNVMTTTELRQVFGDGRIRTPDEQRKFAAPHPRSPRWNYSTADDKNDDLDLFNALTPEQREQVRRYAATRRPPVAFVDLVVRWAVQRGACKETPAPARRRRSPMAAEARAV